jgi:hypothetical protein
MPRTGYERTGPIRGGNTAVIFAIDKSGFYKGIKETGQALDAMQRKINANIKKVGYGTSGNVTVTISDNKLFSAEIIRGLSSALEAADRELAKDLSKTGKQFFQKIIRNAPNRQKGPGRIDTGLMLRSVQGRTTFTKDITYIGFGWDVKGNSPYYRYFSFQEDGTRGGAMPMRAVPQTAKFISEQFQAKMNKDLKTRLDNIK